MARAIVARSRAQEIENAVAMSIQYSKVRRKVFDYVA